MSHPLALPTPVLRLPLALARPKDDAAVCLDAQLQFPKLRPWGSAPTRRHDLHVLALLCLFLWRNRRSPSARLLILQELPTGLTLFLLNRICYLFDAHYMCREALRQLVREYDAAQEVAAARQRLAA